MINVDNQIYSTYLRKNNSTTKIRKQKINEIMKIVGEPKQVTKLLDMCVDYTLQSLKANPTEIKNMNVYNVIKNDYVDLQNKGDIVITPTLEEKEMLEFIKKKTFIKRYADIYSYTLSCVADIEKNMR